jgi:hypothetical protein
MSYVDAGYVAAIGGTFVYALSLVLRRRRWERALDASDGPAEHDDAVAAVDGERS